MAMSYIVVEEDVADSSMRLCHVQGCPGIDSKASHQYVSDSATTDSASLEE